MCAFNASGPAQNIVQQFGASLEHLVSQSQSVNGLLSCEKTDRQAARRSYVSGASGAKAVDDKAVVASLTTA
jgi:hypothetical protein